MLTEELRGLNMTALLAFHNCISEKHSSEENYDRNTGFEMAALGQWMKGLTHTDTCTDIVCVCVCIWSLWGGESLGEKSGEKDLNQTLSTT